MRRRGTPSPHAHDERQPRRRNPFCPGSLLSLLRPPGPAASPRALPARPLGRHRRDARLAGRMRGRAPAGRALLRCRRGPLPHPTPRSRRRIRHGAVPPGPRHPAEPLDAHPAHPCPEPTPRRQTPPATDPGPRRNPPAPPPAAPAQPAAPAVPRRPGGPRTIGSAAPEPLTGLRPAQPLSGPLPAQPLSGPRPAEPLSSPRPDAPLSGPSHAQRPTRRQPHPPRANAPAPDDRRHPEQRHGWPHRPHSPAPPAPS